MKRRNILPVITALVGLFLVALGTVFAWKILKQDLSASIMNEQLKGIHRAAGYDDGIDQGLLELHEQNPDCIYWLKIPDTGIDYPVMFRPEERDYYLDRDFNREYSPHGTLYLAEECDPDTGDNLIIYGHHMQDGSMFAGLEEYKAESFFLSHDRIILETLTGREEYAVIAAFAVPVYTGHDFEYYSFTKAEDPLAYDSFIKECSSRSLYETGVTAEYGDKLLTLSTCEYSHINGRMVVVAVRDDKEVAYAQ